MGLYASPTLVHLYSLLKESRAYCTSVQLVLWSPKSPSERVNEGEEIKVVIEELVNHERNDRRKIRLMTPEVAERRHRCTNQCR